MTRYPSSGGALEAAGLETTYVDPNGVERQVFGGHACRVAGATFLASMSIPMAVILSAARPSKGTPSRRRWRWHRQRRQSPWPGTATGAPLSANAARMLRLVGRDSLVEFAAWASTEEEFFVTCTRPWLQGFYYRLVGRGYARAGLRP